VGHSTGAGGATQAGRILAGFGHHLQSLAYGLIAPLAGGRSGLDIRNLLVLGGTRDLDQNAGPMDALLFGGTPKTWVTIPGANHFGYTDICPPDNTCGSTAKLLDEDGTITRDGQQQTGAAYLAALVRYYALGDQTARPYLSGQRMVEGLETVGVTGLQVQAEGFSPVRGPTPPPTVGSHP
jgi:hypothetical protein